MLAGDRPAAWVMIRARTSTSPARCSGVSRVSGLTGCGVGRKFSDSCTGVLRIDRLLVAGARVGWTPQQTVDDGAQLHQVRYCTQAGGWRRMLLLALAEIRPIGRNEEGIAVRRCEQEMQATVSLAMAKYRNQLPLKRVARPNDDYLPRKRVGVGSLSSDRSTR